MAYEHIFKIDRTSNDTIEKRGEEIRSSVSQNNHKNAVGFKCAVYCVDE